jgi:tripeptidyl-peptidase II
VIPVLVFVNIKLILCSFRLNSMETGTAMARAMSHVMRGEHYKVDLINMSYGEHANWSSSGRIGELMSEVSL